MTHFIVELSWLVYKATEKWKICQLLFHKPQNYVLKCPQPENIQFAVKEEWRNQGIFTFKRQELKTFAFFSLADQPINCDNNRCSSSHQQIPDATCCFCSGEIKTRGSLCFCFSDRAVLQAAACSPTCHTWCHQCVGASPSQPYLLQHILRRQCVGSFGSSRISLATAELLYFIFLNAESGVNLHARRARASITRQ